MSAEQPNSDTLGLQELIEAEQKKYLPTDYEQKSAAAMTFDPRLAYELALEMDKPLDIFARYNYSEDEARNLIAHKPFIATVKKYKEEVLEHGVSFKLKAKIQAEDLLTHSYALAVDPTTPPTVRADLIKWTAKVAGLEPSPSKDVVGGSGQGFTLNITFAGQPTATINAQRVIEGE